METVPQIVNGIDVAGLAEAAANIEKDPSLGALTFRFVSDEPLELFGSNQHANPQEYLIGALNACMVVGYVAGAAMKGIRLESVEIETEGDLDLRGFLGMGEDVLPKYESLRYTVRIRGDGTPEQFQEIHETVKKTSPNYFNVSRAVRLEGNLEIG